MATRRKAPASPRVSPPLQERSREAWQRILDAGLEILAELGVARFNVSAVCERAGVAATAVYSRVGTRDDLLHAVYEEGAARVRTTEHDLASVSQRPDPVAAVDLLVAVFAAHGPFLRAVVLGAGDDAFIAERGRSNLERARGTFLDVALGEGASDPAAVRRAQTLFTTAFSVLAFELAFGAALVRGPEGDAVDELHLLAADLLGRRRGRASARGHRVPLNSS